MNWINRDERGGIGEGWIEYRGIKERGNRRGMNWIKRDELNIEGWKREELEKDELNTEGWKR